MDKPTIASILGTILGLAAGIGGMLLFSPQPAGDNSDLSNRLAAAIRERDDAVKARDDASTALDDGNSKLKMIEQVRARICHGLGFIGIELEEERNAANAGVISAAARRVKVRVIHTDEEQMIAKTVCRVLGLGLKKEN